MLGELGVPRERIRVWRLGVQLPPRRPAPEAGPITRVLMVGRFVEKKGFAYGLEGFARVAAERDDVELSIVGDGEERPEYDRIIAEHKIADRVHFLGVLSHDEVYDQMGRHDLLIAPSVVAAGGDRESGLLVVKESAALTIPTIGTLHGGIPEIIDDDVTGFLVRERDADAIAKRLGQLVADPARRRAMGEAARDKMEREYDIQTRVDVLEEHYDEVLAARR
jgi:colanic acid/amylovoran biosynthesis glycosyltransferase